MKTLVAVLALALLAVSAPAQAQEPNPSGISIDSVDSAGEVPYAGSGEFTFTLSVGCSELLSSPGEDAVVTISDAQAWLNFTEDSVELDPAGCLNPSGRVSADGSIPFTVSASAPGVVSHTVTLSASIGETTSDGRSATYTVEYNSNYTLTPSVQFPLTVTNKTTTFTLTGVQASNAPSMIMLDDFTASNGALVSGFSQLQYLNDGGKPATQTYTISFTAPEEDWETSTITLKVYGHFNFPDGSNAGDPTDRKTLTWEVVNGGVKDDSKGGGSKGSPAPVGVLTALGLVGFAALLRRRSD